MSGRARAIVPLSSKLLERKVNAWDSTEVLVEARSMIEGQLAMFRNANITLVPAGWRTSVDRSNSSFRISEATTLVIILLVEWRFALNVITMPTTLIAKTLVPLSTRTATTEVFLDVFVPFYTVYFCKMYKRSISQLHSLES